jgi:two-component system LytT family sensor kinase
MATDIAHLIGFLTGAALYALLLVMVRENTGSIRSTAGETERSWYERACLPLYIGVLGLLWNLLSLASLLVEEITTVIEPALLSVLAISVLGGLPAVAIHSIWQATAGGIGRRIGLLVLAGYGLSVAVALWNGLAFISGDPVPDVGAWRVLTIGFLVLFFALLLAMKPVLVGHSALAFVLLTVGSVAALPLSHHAGESLPWWFDFLGHHASLPVAVAVLYRDYRFVFLDRFMKRALPFLLLVGMSCGLYVAAVLPFIEGGADGTISPVLSGLIITLWVATAVVYPWVHRKVMRAFDTLVLSRPDYGELRDDLAQRMNEHNTVEAVLGELCQGLQKALRSREVRWEKTADIPALPSLSDAHPRTATSTRSPLRNKVAAPVQTDDGGLTMVVPTLETPRCILTIASRTDDHRFLSEEWRLVEAAALIAARRIDVLRTSHERCEIALREQEMQKLTTEAELRALRAQVNPHFLFNALNTVGYLIDTAPARAASTLRDLTYLLRSILRRMEDNFTTLGEEIELIRSYLDIEKARFEERLAVRIEVPRELHRLPVPALVLQPLVENAIKHGIQPAVNGGEVRIIAQRMRELPRHGGAGPAGERLCIEVRDTGVGATDEVLRLGRREGIGLANVENRLRCHYGARASMQIVSEPGAGTTVTLHLPADEPATPTAVPVAAAASGGRR